MGLLEGGCTSVPQANCKPIMLNVNKNIRIDSVEPLMRGWPTHWVAISLYIGSSCKVLAAGRECVTLF